MDADQVRRWHEELGDVRVAEAVVATRGNVVRPVSDELAHDHLQAMLTEQAQPTNAQPVAVGPPRAPVVDWLRRRRSVATATTSIAAALALVLAVSGSLPDPAQRLVADLASTVGIELPRPEVESDVGSLAPDRSEADLLGSVTDVPDDTTASDDTAESAAPRPTPPDTADEASGSVDAVSDRSDVVPGLPDDAPGRPSPVPVRADDARASPSGTPRHAEQTAGRAPDASERPSGGSRGEDTPSDASKDASPDAAGASQDATGRPDGTPVQARTSRLETAGVDDVPGEAIGHTDDASGNGSDGM